MDEKKIVTKSEIAFIYVALAVMALTAGFVGLADIISLILLPALLAYSFIRLGGKHMLLQCVCIVLFYSFLAGGFHVSAFVVVLPAIMMGVCVKRKKTILNIVTATGVLLTAIECIGPWILSRTSEGEIAVQTLVQDMTQVVEQIGLPAAESAAILEVLQMYMPAMLVLSVALFAYEMFWVLLALLRKTEPALAALYPCFKDLYAKKSSMLVLAIAAIVAFADTGIIGTLAANLMMVLASYIIICGFAVFATWISRVRSSGVRIIWYIVLVWFFSFITPAAFVVGVMDTFLQFRNRKRGDI